MKWQWQALMFVVCLNLATGLVTELNVGGTEYVNPTTSSNPEDYGGHFNATEVAGEWQPEYNVGIPVVGDVYSMFQMFFKVISYLFAGFPIFLNHLGDSFITDASARASYDLFCGVFIALWAIGATILVIEFISGRLLSGD